MNRARSRVAAPPWVSGIACLLAAAGARGGEAPRNACDSATHRQMDFWVGEWLVQHADGKPAGINSVVAVADGCALYETWRGEGGVNGHSLTFYDGVQRKWRQQWVDNTGAVLELAGGRVGASILLIGESQELTGRVLQRLTFTPVADGSIRQLWETSADGGKRWKTEFDGRYVRKP